MTQFSSSKYTLLFLGIFSMLFNSCSESDDDGDGPSDPFYRGAMINADVRLLNSYWSVYEVNFDGSTANVPISYGGCDRDFFRFFDQGSYKEFVIQDSSCIPNGQELQWSFQNGIIKLENSFKEFSEMVILELSASKFLFRAKYDVDEDGKEDVLQFLAKPYQPNERYFYSNAILQDETIKNKIHFKWEPYNGLYSFDRYEIFVSTENCDPSKATLLATINVRETTFFEDTDPPVAPYYCYFLKIYTDKGLLFESSALGISADHLDVQPVSLMEPMVQNDRIFLQWEPYEGLYFSHYEVAVGNYADGYSGYDQDLVLARVTDINTTTYLDEKPPLVKNPVYKITVVNKFERRSYYNPLVKTSVREANYTPKGVIELRNINAIAPAPIGTIVYMAGETLESSNPKIIRYNYATNTVEAISNVDIYTDPKNALRAISSSVGEELLSLSYYNNIMVFNAVSMEYKYVLDNSGIGNIHDFLHLNGDRYLIIDDQYAYVAQRDFSNLTILEKQEHALGATTYFPLKALKINDDRYMIGNGEKSQSTIFTIDPNGLLVNKTESNVPLTAKLPGETVFNTKYNTVINFNEKRMYNLETDGFTSFEQPYFPLALSQDQNLIIGTSNDPNNNGNVTTMHKKEITIMNLPSASLTAIDTDGYPHYIFENQLGQIISLSTYFVRQNITLAFDKPDFFFEMVSP